MKSVSQYEAEIKALRASLKNQKQTIKNWQKTLKDAKRKKDAVLIATVKNHMRTGKNNKKAISRLITANQKALRKLRKGK